MKSYNLYDVGSQAISSRFKKANPARIKAVLLALDPLSPKRAYSKLSRILEYLQPGYLLDYMISLPDEP